jgi:hypothetical protein
VALAEGRAMLLEGAAEYAHFREKSNDEIDPPAASTPGEPLSGEPSNKQTRREQEVAALVTRGLTKSENDSATQWGLYLHVAGLGCHHNEPRQTGEPGDVRYHGLRPSEYVGERRRGDGDDGQELRH